MVERANAITGSHKIYCLRDDAVAVPQVLQMSTIIDSTAFFYTLQADVFTLVSKSGREGKLM